MAKKTRRKIRKKAGLPPGTLIFTGDRKMENPNVTISRYNGTEWQEHPMTAQEVPALEPGMVTWFNIRGLHEVALVELIGQKFDIHPLVLEDIVNIHQRPKFEEYDNGFFLIARSLDFDREKLEVTTEQVAIFVGKGFVLSFQEYAPDVFQPVSERLIGGRGKIRHRGPDYLAYALMDAVVDNYYNLLDAVEEVIDDIEQEILTEPSRDSKSKIHQLKREMLTVRRTVTPLREAVSRFSKAETDFVDPGSVVFIRDLYDHVVQVMDAVETYRDTLTGLQDLYLSELSFRMNNVMQVLTVMSTIFIPLTFLAGIYGMNFKYMPELKWRYGYFILWAIMILVALGLLHFFRRKRWL